MYVNEESIDKEMELWKGFYNNYEHLAINILADVLAHYKKEDRAALIEKVEETLESVVEPIDGVLMLDSIKGDIESFDRINDESSVAYRTLSWIKEIAEKPEITKDEIEKDSE